MNKALKGLKAAGFVVVIGCAFLFAVSAEEVQVRGTVANLGIPEYTWDNSSFAGFYYDINKNLGAETITFRLSNANPASATLSDQADANNNRGIQYNTIAQDKNFKFRPWGSYRVIGFLFEKYFAAYNNYAPTPEMEAAGISIPFLADKSKNDNLMTNEQLSKVLMDDNTEMLITSSSPLKLKEGYELALMFVNASQAVVELKKNNVSVDSKIIQPSIDNANMADKTYYYKTNIGNTADIVAIAVHFKNVIHGPDKDFATVDGIFQISDTPTPITTDQQYDKMSIRNVDPSWMSITMDNKDNQITLTKNKDIPLMGKIHIKTADQDSIDAGIPLRYYIYAEETCECG
jgi:S-layer protein (TIGR01567 family)